LHVDAKLVHPGVVFRGATDLLESA